MLDIKILCLIAGILAGILRSVMGYLESTEPFNFKLFSITLVRTVILAALMGYGLNQEPVMAFFTVFFADSLVHKGYKITKNHVNNN